MNAATVLADLEKRLENRIVCDVLKDMSRTFNTWDGGGELVHRVRAAGHTAETGIRNIVDGNTSIKRHSTFKEMRQVSNDMYEDTIKFLYPILKSGIYSH